MPADRILKVLKMTPQEWGLATQAGQRDELRAKAKRLMDAENAQNNGPSLHDQIAALSERVSALEEKGHKRG